MANPHHHLLSRWRTFIQSLQILFLSFAHRPLNRQRRLFLLMGATTFVAYACRRVTPPDNRPITSASTAVKRVQHAFGETEIPARPTRVIVWGYTTIEAVVAHGLQPIGVPRLTSMVLQAKAVNAFTASIVEKLSPTPLIRSTIVVNSPPKRFIPFSNPILRGAVCGESVALENALYGTVTSRVNAASQKAQMIHNQELQAVDTDQVIADELWSFVKKTETMST